MRERVACEGVDAAMGYRNGLGKPRRLSLSVGTITLRRPRVRGLRQECFDPRAVVRREAEQPDGERGMRCVHGRIRKLLVSI